MSIVDRNCHPGWPLLKHFLMLAVITLLSVPCRADLVVVVNPGVSINTLTQEEVARIFMKKSKVLPDGSEIIPLAQSSRPEINEAFFLGVTGQIKMRRDAYWARLLFTGKGGPPEDAKSDKGVKKRVAADKRYIGFIDAKAADKTIKVVYRVPVSVTP